MDKEDKILVGDLTKVTDYVANGSFASLKENVSYDYKKSFAVLIRLVDFKSNWNGPFVYVDESSYKFLKKSSLEVGDLIISNVGAYAGTVFRAPNLELPMTLGPNSIVLKDLKCSDFWYYYFSSTIGQNQIDSIKTGSAQPKFNKTDFRKLEVPNVPITKQRAIASLLGALDDKIQNNHQINETLEEMARTIYKSWFVDFNPVHEKASGIAPAHMDTETASLFPNSFGDDGLPTGWKKIYLNDLTNIVYGKHLPTKQLVKSGYPVFGGNGVIGFHSEYLYEEPQVLVACRGAASGKVIRSLPFSFVTNNSLVIEITNPHLNRFFLELYLKDLTLEGFTTGSAQPQMTINNMDAVKLLNPTKEILNCFQTMVKPYFDKVLKNDVENKTLGELRDTILPKLMSGEILVKDAEREMGKAV